MKKESKENIQKELLELGSSLKVSSRASAGDVPQGYFDQFPDLVQQKIAARPAGIRTFPLRRFVPAMASFALIIAVVLSFLLMKNGTDQGIFAQGDEAVVDDYFAFVSEYDHTLIYEVTSQDALFDEDHGFLPGNATPSEEDPMIEYMLDMAEYYGINTTNLIAEQD